MRGLVWPISCQKGRVTWIHGPPPRSINKYSAQICLALIFLKGSTMFSHELPFSSGFLWENIYFDQCYKKDPPPPSFWQKNGSLTSVLVLLTSSNWRPPPLEHSHFTSQQTVHQSIQFYFDENCLNIIICLCYTTTTLITQLCSIKIAHSFPTHRWVNPCLVDWEIVWGVLGRALGWVSGMGEHSEQNIRFRKMHFTVWTKTIL